MYSWPLLIIQNFYWGGGERVVNVDMRGVFQAKEFVWGKAEDANKYKDATLMSHLNNTAHKNQ